MTKLEYCLILAIIGVTILIALELAGFAPRGPGVR